MKWLVFFALLPGCAHYEGQKVMADPLCKFTGKPVDYRLPKHCNDTGSSITVTAHKLTKYTTVFTVR
jgi:hypothetical protein